MHKRILARWHSLGPVCVYAYALSGDLIRAGASEPAGTMASADRGAVGDGLWPAGAGAGGETGRAFHARAGSAAGGAVSPVRRGKRVAAQRASGSDYPSAPGAGSALDTAGDARAYPAG